MDGPCRILWDNKQVANFKADGQEIEFTVSFNLKAQVL